MKNAIAILIKEHNKIVAKITSRVFLETVGDDETKKKLELIDFAKGLFSGKLNLPGKERDILDKYRPDFEELREYTDAINILTGIYTKQQKEKEVSKEEV